MIKKMGAGWVLFRMQYEAKKRLGILKRKFPAGGLIDSEFLRKLSGSFRDEHEFLQWWSENKPGFFFQPEDIRKLGSIFNRDNQALLERADRALDNEFLYFSSWFVQHEEIDWHKNPVSNKNMPADVHWTKIEELSAEAGDVKYIWELSRFSFVYDWVRAFGVTGDEKYAEAFWSIFEDWDEKNPVELGVNWKCSQELSLRAMAWMFGLYAFYDAVSTTDERLIRLFKQLCCHGRHIDKNFDFALKAIRNNHVISEAAGLYTLGLLCPFFKDAKRWLDKGKKHLEYEGLRQIYEDGSYLQHSVNYQRMVGQLYTWCIQLGKCNGIDFSAELKGRVNRCVLFLYHLQDEVSGRLPNYGMNDGSLIFRLSACDYLDYRPQLQAACFVLTGRRLYPKGGYDEELVWFCGEEALLAKPLDEKRVNKEFSTGGYYVIHGKEQLGMTRCTTYRNRPVQADMLHFDLWYRGVNILCDAGTYSYNTGAEWLNYFKGTASHNTVMIDGKNQMKKGPRFLWLDWTKGKTITFVNNLFEGEHYGYGNLVHRRGILHQDGIWIIVDDVFGTFDGPHSIRQSWLSGVDVCKIGETGEVFLETQDKAFTMYFQGATENVRAFYGDSEEFRGWRSLYYGEKIPAYQVCLDVVADKPVRLITGLVPEKDVFDLDTVLERAGVTLGEIGAERIFN